MSKHLKTKNNHYEEGFLFEQMEEFKYLRVKINGKNNTQSKNKLITNAANRSYYAMKEMFSSKLLSRRTKERL